MKAISSISDRSMTTVVGVSSSSIIPDVVILGNFVADGLLGVLKQLLCTELRKNEDRQRVITLFA